jgi:PAS domain S-box-containing protein
MSPRKIQSARSRTKRSPEAPGLPTEDLSPLILRQIRDSIIAVDLSGRILFWNQGATALFGYTDAEMLGQSLARLYPTRAFPPLQTNLKDLQAGLDYEGEWEGLRKDGSRLWLHTRRSVLKDSRGKTIGYLGTSKDITRRKREMEAVRQSEQLYRAVGESIDFGVWSCDPDGRMTHMSDSFLKVLGVTHAQNIGDAWLNALHPEERTSILLDWRECLRTGKPWIRRYRILGADGRYRPVLAHGAPVRDEKGEILCWAGLNLDLDQIR